MGRFRLLSIVSMVIWSIRNCKEMKRIIEYKFVS